MEVKTVKELIEFLNLKLNDTTMGYEVFVVDGEWEDRTIMKMLTVDHKRKAVILGVGEEEKNEGD